MFKKIAYILLISFAVVGLGFYLKALKTAADLRNTVQTKEVLGVDRHSVFIEVVKPFYVPPKRVQIPSAKIDVDLVKVGVEPGGALEAPKDWFKGGWYLESANAGEIGNMVIDGHYDTNTGAAAAFYTLQDVKTGDIVTIVDEVGRSYQYQVSEVFFLDINDPNRLQIFDEKKDTAHITLITCGGVWSTEFATYSKRLVVKAELSAEAGR